MTDAERGDESAPENVVLVTVDSLRFDRVLPERDPTDPELAPAIEALAEEGVAFSRAYATGPGTTPTFPALLTGTLPLSYGGLGPLSDDRPRMAANLRAAGLDTSGFQCNPFLSATFGYDRGFDAFEDYQNPLMGVTTRVFPRGIELNNPRLRRLDEFLHLTDAIKRGYRLVAGKPRPYVSAEVVTDDALAWLDGRDRPFFLWAHYMDVHHPCHPPREYRERFGVGGATAADVSDLYSDLLTDPDALSTADLERLRSLYDAAIAYADDQVRRIFDRLRERGLYDDTLVVVTSDHGELFGEHGGYGKPERMYDELLRVPLVVANGPDRLAGATEDLVSLLDLPPLIHDALGVDVPSEYAGRVPGRDPPREYVTAEHEVEGDVVVGARSRGWLYEADEIAGEHRLFDCRDGFREVTPGDHADDPGARTVREAVLGRLSELDVDPTRVGEGVEGDVRDRLEDLGYL
ncbi:sulfatase [Halobacteriales archaeon QS_8_69_26]|nr:MAG: sulfatase [Halobacteriales archaeon QS_8_69_26]